jgi:DNA-binding transcriptional MerR regulator
MTSSNANEQQGYSGARAAEIVGISYRQLDYWARTDLVRPSLTDAKGSGSRRRYSYTDLLELRVIKSLLDAGIKLESVRDIFGYLREQLGEEITSANLVIQGSRSVVIQSDGELIDLVKRGQGVLNILPLGGVRDEMDARIRELHPTDAETAPVTAGHDRPAAIGE